MHHALMHARTLLANCTQSQQVRFERCELTHAHDTVMLRIAASKRPAEWPTAILHFGGDWLGVCWRQARGDPRK